MHARSAVVLCAVFVLAYACGSGPHAFSMVTAGRTAVAASDRPTSAAAIVRHPVDAGNTLTPTLDVTVHSEEVRFVLHVTNTSKKKLELTFPNGQTHDLTVLDAAGSEVWRWGSGQMFTQALRNQPLDPQASITYTVRWRQPAAHGPLTAVATLTSTNYPVESRAAFALP